MHHTTQVVVERRNGESDMSHGATQVDFGKGQSPAFQCHHVDAKGTDIRELPTEILACDSSESIKIGKVNILRQYLTLNCLGSKQIAYICSINGLEQGQTHICHCSIPTALKFHTEIQHLII